MLLALYEESAAGNGQRGAQVRPSVEVGTLWQGAIAGEGEMRYGTW